MSWKFFKYVKDYKRSILPNDKWTKRMQPYWFENMKQSILKNKDKLINKINTQVRDILPSLVEKRR